jgi:NAD-dependent SIR2 family protein deacetylase
MQYPWKTAGERWGYIATFLHTTQTAPVREPYRLLRELLRGKDYFVITTNQDTQAVKAFPEERVAQLQGSHYFFQCSRCCTDDTWDAVEPVQKMIDAMGEGTSVPDELIPRCPHCGAEAFPWVRGYGNLLEGTRYQNEYRKASDWIESVRGKNTLYLELGVGRLTPMFIQEPFWMLVASDSAARYATVNAKNPIVPRSIEDRALAIEGDIASALRRATDARKEEVCLR